MAEQGIVTPPTGTGYSSLHDIVLNYAGAVVVIAFGYALYTHHPWILKFYTGQQRDWFLYMAWFYLAILPLYYRTLPRGYIAKSRRAVWYLRECWRRRPTEDERVAVLATFIKLFYLPMMLMWLVAHSQAVANFAQEFLAKPQFLPTGYWLLFNFMFWLDVLCFTIGYGVEHPRLGNEIRSVEPTFAGWFVTLACYPPFNNATVTLLGWPTDDYPPFANPAVQTVACILALMLLAVYASASVALALKASNLTHRGIVQRGPYRWVRHPAYIAKNLSWWIGALPIIAGQWAAGASAGVLALLGMAGWSTLYYFRAITEERHLLRDPVYQEYCRRVRYRFIPGVW